MAIAMRNILKNYPQKRSINRFQIQIKNEPTKPKRKNKSKESNNSIHIMKYCNRMMLLYHEQRNGTGKLQYVKWRKQCKYFTAIDFISILIYLFVYYSPFYIYSSDSGSDFND
jgi:hypothetical protein